MTTHQLCGRCDSHVAQFTVDWPDDGLSVCTTCLPLTIAQYAQYGHAWPMTFGPDQYPRYLKVTPMELFDQYLVDYTVRNLTTGDEEEIRVLEIDDVSGFPDRVRDEVQSYIAVGNDVMGGGRPHMDWEDAQDALRQILMPYISEPDLYETRYNSWEQHVLGNEDVD